MEKRNEVRAVDVGPRATDVADFMSTLEPKIIEVASAVRLNVKSVMKRAHEEINFTPQCPT